ncbi:MAG: hypothetical protein JSR34_08155 [Proteobacteria bacterium]|nr:hypothetical protein [Pseudomonadota bacterium]
MTAVTVASAAPARTLAAAMTKVAMTSGTTPPPPGQAMLPHHRRHLP